MIFYRYEAVQYADMDHDGEYVRPYYPNPTIELREYNLHKETPKGYWIGWGDSSCGLQSHSKWVSKTARKRYAYPTKEEAMLNYIKRTERRVGILRAQLGVSEAALNKAKGMKS